jgi:histidine kinase
LPVKADQDRITQVLTNIIGNALTATPAGGSVIVETRAKAPLAQVVITDTGVGSAEADVERVFERFYRAPRCRVHPHPLAAGTYSAASEGTVSGRR